jgi:hypothetical protein
MLILRLKIELEMPRRMKLTIGLNNLMNLGKVL